MGFLATLGGLAREGKGLSSIPDELQAYRANMQAQRMNEQNMKIKQFEFEKVKQEQAEYDKPVSLNDFAHQFSAYGIPEVESFVLDSLKGNGIDIQDIGGEKIIKQGDAQKALKYVASNYETLGKLSTLAISGINRQIQELESAGKSKDTDKTLQGLYTKKQVWFERFGTAEQQKRQAEETEAQTKLENRINIGNAFIANNNITDPNKVAYIEALVNDPSVSIDKIPEMVMGKADAKTNITDTQLYAELSTSNNPEDLRKAEKMMLYKRESVDESGLKALQKRMLEIQTAAELERQKAIGGGEITPTTKKENAKSMVTNELKTLSNLYTTLNSIGAAVNIKNSKLENLWNWAKTTGAGQTIGKALATEEQSYRNQIASIRPLLINNIRQASEMGARGLDSEKELEFYLQAATDPSRDVQANLAAIDVLDKAYGLGMGVGIKVDSNALNNLKKEARTQKEIVIETNWSPEAQKFFESERKR